MNIKQIIQTSVVVLVFLSSLVNAQMMPSHGSAAAGRQPAVYASAPLDPAFPVAWRNDLGIEFTYVPSPRNRCFDDALGFGLSTTLALQPAIGIRLGAGFESFQAKSQGKDADVIPLGLSFLMGPPVSGPFNYGVEAGLRYLFVDFSDDGGSYDNGLGGIVGLILSGGGDTGFAVETGISYRFDISKASNNERDKLSLEGLSLKLALRFSY